jgi:hypothetical protein
MGNYLRYNRQKCPGGCLHGVPILLVHVFIIDNEVAVPVAVLHGVVPELFATVCGDMLT